MSSKQKYLALEAYVKTKIPGFEVREKGKKYPDDPWYRSLADDVARCVAPEYDTRFATTMYPFIYVPADWMDDYTTMLGTLRHEYIHLRDAQKYGIWFAASYIALAPAVLTMRSHWEYRGYAQNLIMDVERYGKVRPERLDWMLENFTGRNYFFMDPLFAHKRIPELIDAAESGKISGLWPHDDGDFTTT